MIADVALVLGVPLVAASLDSWWQSRKRPLDAQAQLSTQPRKPLPAVGSMSASVCQLELQVGFLLREVLWLRRQVEAHGAELETPRSEAADPQLEVAQ